MVLNLFIVLVGKVYVAGFFAMPFVCGFFVGSYVKKRPFLYSLLVLAVGLFILIVTLQEGIICILFALPIFAVELLIGTFCGKYISQHFRYQKYKKSLNITVLLAWMTWYGQDVYFDQSALHPWHEISSKIEINASVGKTFDILANGLKVGGDWPFLLKLGLPIPSILSFDEKKAGGKMHIVFNHGSAYGKIKEWQTGRLISFDLSDFIITDEPFHITRLGKKEHFGLKTERVTDWLTFGTIIFTFEKSAKGTLLTRKTVFQRHLFPSFYFGTLQEFVIEKGHNSLLLKIKAEVEEQATLSMLSLDLDTRFHYLE